MCGVIFYCPSFTSRCVPPARVPNQWRRPMVIAAGWSTSCALSRQSAAATLTVLPPVTGSQPELHVSVSVSGRSVAGWLVGWWWLAPPVVAADQWECVCVVSRLVASPVPRRSCSGTVATRCASDAGLGNGRPTEKDRKWFAMNIHAYLALLRSNLIMNERFWSKRFSSARLALFATHR